MSSSEEDGMDGHADDSKLETEATAISASASASFEPENETLIEPWKSQDIEENVLPGLFEIPKNLVDQEALDFSISSAFIVSKI